ncbi:MAG: alpha/beta hydrolase [Acidobacteria bacterium]|nr:alpha/beta hydrolase [Acidobacteriota bacterium]
MLKTLVGSIEPRLVFFPYRGENENPATLGVRYQTVPLTTSDGERLVAWQLEPERPLADVVYFHGNGGNLSVWLPVLASLHRLRYRVLAVDYRGYGLSTGSPTEQGLYLDAEATVRHAARSRSAARPLVFWGRSLGATVAASATRVVTPDGLVLESGFPDKAAVIRTHPVFRALNVFSSYRFPTVELLRDFRKPVLVVHGTRDSIIPHALGRELFERLNAPKQFVAVEGADHNDFLDEGHTAYWGPIVRFLDGLAR